MPKQRANLRGRAPLSDAVACLLPSRNDEISPLSRRSSNSPTPLNGGFAEIDIPPARSAHQLGPQQVLLSARTVEPARRYFTAASQFAQFGRNM